MHNRATVIAEKSMPEPNSGCWLWLGYTDSVGYGMICLGGKKGVRAHRLSYEMAHGPVPEGLDVLHRCDTRSCVNPDHLFAGTHAQNMEDMRKKGRVAHGEGHVRARLTADQVMQIRCSTRTSRDLAREFGVNQSTISQAKARRSWQRVR